GCEEAVPRGVQFATTETFQLLADDRVVPVQEHSPAPVTHLGSDPRGPDDICEEDGCEHPLSSALAHDAKCVDHKGLLQAKSQRIPSLRRPRPRTTLHQCQSQVGACSRRCSSPTSSARRRSPRRWTTGSSKSYSRATTA